MIIQDSSIQAVDLAIDCLQSRHLMLYPTDTIYGLGCDAQDEDTVNQLRTAKGREASKPFLILAGSVKKVQQHFETKPFEKQLKEFWPGPVTVLLKPTDPNLNHLKGPTQKIGVRVAQDPFLKRLFNTWDGLLISTSANLANQPYQSDWNQLLSLFSNKLHLCIERQSYQTSSPSTLIDWNQGKWKIIRSVGNPLLEKKLGIL